MIAPLNIVMSIHILYISSTKYCNTDYINTYGQWHYEEQQCWGRD